MSGTWSKEERHNFERSEVMSELETKILETIKRADILQQKIANIGDVGESAAEAKESVEGLTESIKNLKQVSDSACDGKHYADDDDADDEVAEQGLQDEVLEDLRVLASAAIAEGNIKLAYRIERTIDEILEQDTSCM